MCPLRVEREGEGPEEGVERHVRAYGTLPTYRHPSEGWGPYGLSLDASLRWHDGLILRVFEPKWQSERISPI
jgi:hypothetical protein